MLTMIEIILQTQFRLFLLCRKFGAMLSRIGVFIRISDLSRLAVNIGACVSSALIARPDRYILRLPMVVCMLSVLMGCLVSCKTTAIQSSQYPNYEPVTSAPVLEVAPDIRIDCDFIAAPMRVICGYYALSYGITLSVDDKYLDKAIDLCLNGCSLLESLAHISRLLGLDVIPVGSGYHIGKPTDNDRIIVSGHCYGYDVDFLRTTISSLLTGCFCNITPDGYCIVSCVPSSAERVRAVLDAFSGGRMLYRVRWRWVSNWLDIDLLDGDTAIIGDVARSLKDWYWGDWLTGRVRFTLGGQSLRTNVDVAHDMVLVAGEQSQFFSGEEIPVARHAISSEGYNSVTGYDTIEVGDRLRITATSADTKLAGSVLLQIDYEQSSVSGYVDGYPHKLSHNYKLSCVVPCGAVYCISDFGSRENSYGWLKLLRRNRSRKLLVSVLPLGT